MLKRQNSTSRVGSKAIFKTMVRVCECARMCRGHQHVRITEKLGKDLYLSNIIVSVVLHAIIMFGFWS